MQGTAGTLETAERQVGSAALRAVSIRDFRNFSRLDLTVPEAGVMIVGPNGSGKTNLLEALYYLEIFRSFRGARDRELPRFGQDVFRVEATVVRGASTVELAAAWQKSTRRKKVEIDGHEPERLSDALGTLGAVVFSLDDSELIWGSPARRRRYLDILLSLVEPGYVGALQRYRAVLGQRNEALRQGRLPVVRAWADGLVEPGAALMAARAAWTAERDDAFGRYHAAVAGGATAALSYSSCLGDVEPPDGGDEDAWADAFRRALAANEESDRRRGMTQVGPHRDDLVIRAVVDAGAERRDLRSYGSGGQRRTAAIALRLVEADTLTDRSGAEPIYLLDDVFAELDRERSTRVLELLEQGRSGQVLLTAPKPVDLPLRGGSLPLWRIDDGRIVTDD
ncbi:MAG TPA: DNA replication and repair protein RecF [Gemmatimonadota bacterium]|nr:DNA replication and repair protein RecF [Gemmatimonadota bacterium]